MQRSGYAVPVKITDFWFPCFPEGSVLFLETVTTKCRILWNKMGRSARYNCDVEQTGGLFASEDCQVLSAEVYSALHKDLALAVCVIRGQVSLTDTGS